MRLCSRLALMSLMGLTLCGCSSYKNIYLINYRKEGIFVSVHEQGNRKHYVPPVSARLLGRSGYVGSDLKLFVTAETGLQQTLRFSRESLKSATIERSIVIVEVR